MTIAISKEQKFSDLILGHYRSLLTNHPDLHIDAGKNILTDVTCIYEKGKFVLVYGFSQTDIACRERFKPNSIHGLGISKAIWGV